MSDTLLFERWRQKGDAEAFGEIVSRYSGMVYATCRRILHNAEEAEDAAQDCFVELMRTSLDPSTSFGPWLHTVAVRRSLDRSRSSARRLRRESHYDRDGDTFQPELETAELLAHIDEAIAALPGPLRVLVIGRYLERRTHDDLAAATGVSESAVRYRLDKGVEQIRETLQKRGVTVESYLLASVMGSQLTGTAPSSLAVSLGKLALGGVQPPAAEFTPTVPLGPVAKTVSVWKVLALLTVAAVVTAAIAAFVYEPPKPPVESPATASSFAKRQVPQARQKGTVPGQPKTPGKNEGNKAPEQADAVKPAESVPAAPAANPPVPRPVSSPCSISGAVSDAAGQGIAGARVSATAWNTYDSRSMRVWYGETDAAGHYTVSGIGLDSHDFADVSVSAEGFQTDGRRVDVKAGQDLADINFTVSEGVSLNGRVLDLSGRPVPAAAVVCRSMNSRSGFGTANYSIASTDADGTFTMGFRSEGVAALLVVPPGLPESFFPAVPVGEGRTHDLRLTEPASLSGRVVHPDGTPAADVDLSLSGRYAPDGGTPNYAGATKSWNEAEISTAYNRQATTGRDGRYSFTDLPAAPDLLLDFNKRPEGDGMIGVKLFTEDLGPIAPGGRRTWDSTLLAASELMTIRGRLLGMHSGKPVDGVVAYENTRTREGSVVPGDLRKGGAYELKLTTPGTYELWGRHSSNAGDNGQEARDSIPWVAGTTRTLDIRVPDPFIMSISVIDTEGLPVQGATVTTGQGTYFPTTKTDEQGRYGWDGFAPGIEAHFTVTKEGYRKAQSQPIAGEPGAVYPEETIVLRRIDEPEEVYPRPEELVPRQDEALPRPEEALPKPTEVLPVSGEELPMPDEIMPRPGEVPPMPEEAPAPEGRGRKPSRRH